MVGVVVVVVVVAGLMIKVLYKSLSLSDHNYELKIPCKQHFEEEHAALASEPESRSLHANRLKPDTLQTRKARDETYKMLG